jgi:hypothetical protein
LCVESSSVSQATIVRLGELDFCRKPEYGSNKHARGASPLELRALDSGEGTRLPNRTVETACCSRAAASDGTSMLILTVATKR